jgi:hypothetical protein
LGQPQAGVQRRVLFRFVGHLPVDCTSESTCH